MSDLIERLRDNAVLIERQGDRVQSEGVARLLEEAADALERQDDLRKLLGKYGGHTEFCMVPMTDCTCGWSDLLDSGKV